MTKLQNPLEEILSRLTKEEERVIRLRIGIVDEEPGRRRSVSEIARELNVTRYRIRQIEAKALKKLRFPPSTPEARDYRAAPPSPEEKMLMKIFGYAVHRPGTV